LRNKNTSKKFFCNSQKFQLKTNALALMGTASFCGGVRHKRYSEQRETAPSREVSA